MSNISELPRPDLLRSNHTWVDTIEHLNFRSEVFQPFGDWFLYLYNSDCLSIQPMMDRVLERTIQTYNTQDGLENLKAYVVGVVLTQLNEDTNKRTRKNEFDIDGKPLPYSVHFTRMYLDAVDLKCPEWVDLPSEEKRSIRGAKTHVMQAICLHDIVEDILYSHNGRIIKNVDFYPLIEEEFVHGNKIADLLKAETKINFEDDPVIGIVDRI